MMQFNKYSVLTVFVCLLMSGCVSRDYSDLEAKLAEIMVRPPGRIDPIPAVEPYEAYVYESGSLGARDPFKLFYEKEIVNDDTGLVDDGLSEEMRRVINDRNREELESYELDSLRMVGTIEYQNGLWALVIDPDRGIHKISVDNYLGKNFGRVVNIAEDKVELREIVQDGQGRWGERDAALALIADE